MTFLNIDNYTELKLLTYLKYIIFLRVAITQLIMQIIFRAFFKYFWWFQSWNCWLNSSQRSYLNLALISFLIWILSRDSSQPQAAQLLYYVTQNPFHSITQLQPCKHLNCWTLILNNIKNYEVTSPSSLLQWVKGNST